MDSQHTRHSMPMLALLYCGAFISAFNENIMNVALLDIGEQYGVSPQTSAWLVTGYMIITSVIVASMAFLLRRFSARTLFLVAALAFVAGHTIAFFAPATLFSVLLVGRLMQSIGSGVFIPLMMNAVVHCAPREKVGTFLSLGNAVLVLGPALAPVISGVAVTYFGWRAVFVFPGVVGIIMLLLGARLVFNFVERDGVKADLLGLVTLALGITAFVYGIGALSHNLPLGLGVTAGSLIILAFFFTRSLRIAQPLVNVKPLTQHGFILSVLLVIIGMMTSFSLSVLLPVFSESVFGKTALVAGVLLLPAIAMNSVTAVFAGRIFDKRGIWPLLPAGLLLVVIGQIFIAYGSYTIDENAGGGQLALVIVASMVAFAGIGFVLAPAQSAGLAGLKPQMRGDGISIANTALMVSGSIGPALYISLMEAVAGRSPSPVDSAHGFAVAMGVGVIIAILGFLIAVRYALMDKKARRAVSRGEDIDTGTSEETNVFVYGRIDGDAQQVRVSDVMNKQPYYVTADSSVSDVITQLAEHKTSGVPIVDEDKKIRGFISDGDIMRRLARAHTRAHFDFGVYIAELNQSDEEDMRDMNKRVERILAMPVLDMAQTSVVSAHVDMSLEELASLMSEKHIKKMPVTDANGMLVGSISRSDIVRDFLQSFTVKV